MPSGALYLVATPIGNLEDITLRALRILKEVDLIACEDTRHTARLLTHFGISTRRESYHEHNEASRTRQIVELLRAGKNVALVSDAGTPLISDPGYVLVSSCRSEGIPVVPIPGPVAAVAALSASGLPADRFCFVGFLPPKSAARKAQLERLRVMEATLIFFESPHRIVRALEDMCQILGTRPACLVREMTKIHEEWLRAPLDEILAALRARPAIQGEITLIVARGIPETRPAEYPASIHQHLEQEMAQTGGSRKEALKRVARQRGISRRDAYQQLLKKP